MENTKEITIGLLIPVLNEIDGLKEIFPIIDKEIFDQILFVDGGSTDGTLAFLKENNCEYINQKVPGLSEAILEGINALNTDCVIEFSPDGNCIPKYLNDVVK